MLIYKSVCFLTIWTLTSIVYNTNGQNIDDEPQLPIKECKDEVCVPVYQCKEAMDKYINRNYNGLRSMFCGFNGTTAQVCCKSSRESVSNTDGLVFQDESQKQPQVQSVLDSSQQEVPNQVQSVLDSTETLKISEQTTTTLPTYKLPGRHICGQANPPNRIVGGVVTDINELPWTALIQYENDGKNAYLCIGTLITDRHVLTAAHCVATRPGVNVVKVILGEWDLESDNDCVGKICSPPPLHLEIDSIKLHEKFEPRDKNHDIAIIKLKTSVTFTDFIQPVCLPDTQDIAAMDYIIGTSYTTVGWGATEFKQMSVVKRKVDLNAVPTKQCREAGLVNDLNLPYIICAGGMKGKDTCKGDSGGPLVKVVDKNQSFNWYLFGITSAGASKCGTEGVPGLYTRIVPHLEWIIANI